MTEMTSRDRVLAAAHRQVPDRVPRTIPLEHGVSELLKAYLGVAELEQYLKVDMTWVEPNPTVLKTNFSQFFPRAGVTWDEWGRGRIWDKEDHYAEYLYSLEKAERPDEILAYPWPDFSMAYRYEGMPEKVAAIQAQGQAVIGSLEETVFEIAWQLRSMERLFQDIIFNDEKAPLLLDLITERQIAKARAFATAGVDLICTGDDVAMQNGLLMSHKMWKQWFRPRLERVIHAAREIKPEVLIWYHSDGKINDLVPDLISVGVDILNPVQPECVDHRWIKATFGDRLSFSGGLGVQSILPFGTPEEVRMHVKQTIEILGKGGGLIVGPSHVIERDTPIENILAMLDAIDQYGKY